MKVKTRKKACTINENKWCLGLWMVSSIASFFFMSLVSSASVTLYGEAAKTQRIDNEKPIITVKSKTDGTTRPPIKGILEVKKQKLGEL